MMNVLHWHRRSNDAIYLRSTGMVAIKENNWYSMVHLNFPECKREGERMRLGLIIYLVCHAFTLSIDLGIQRSKTTLIMEVDGQVHSTSILVLVQYCTSSAVHFSHFLSIFLRIYIYLPTLVEPKKNQKREGGVRSDQSHVIDTVVNLDCIVVGTQRDSPTTQLGHWRQQQSAAAVISTT